MSGIEVLGAVSAACELCEVGWKLSKALGELASRYRKGGLDALVERRKQLNQLIRIAREIAGRNDAAGKGANRVAALESVDTDACPGISSGGDRFEQREGAGEGAGERASLNTNTQVAAVLTEILEQTKAILDAVEKLNPGSTAGKGQRIRVALGGKAKEDNIEKGLTRLEGLKINLLICLATSNNFSTNKMLESLEGLKLQKTEPVKEEIGHFMVPFARNDRFVGREEVLSNILERLGKSQGRLVLVALGGAGKSQVEIETAYRIKDKYPQMDIFWISASSVTAFDHSCREIATQTGLDVGNKQAVDIRIMVKQWLERGNARRWLLIVDAADEEDLFDREGDGAVEEEGGEGKTRDHKKQGPHFPSLLRYLPMSPNGMVFLTSRSKKTAVKLAGPNVVTLPTLSVEDGKETFFKHAIILDRNEVDKDVTELVKILCSLPLAIVQAAAYINENDVAARTYLTLYAENDNSKLTFLNNEFTMTAARQKHAMLLQELGSSLSKRSSETILSLLIGSLFCHASLKEALEKRSYPQQTA